MMSWCRCWNSGTRMCSMLAREPVSKLSTQITRCPRRSSSSQRCDPRNPAPPVTRQVAMAAQDSGAARLRAQLPVRSGSVPGGLELALGHHLDHDVAQLAVALGVAALGESLPDDRAALAAGSRLAALALTANGVSRLPHHAPR